MGNHKHYRDKTRNKGASRDASRSATAKEKQKIPRSGISKGRKARARREYDQARLGLMNDHMGIYRPTHQFTFNGMVAGYKAGYRIA